ncbi:hypothetical protein AB0C38_15785 [Amycolatopsis sp. NPDC048633]|uniref:hypothetical protein n=1 Tax=Amycolatopsis sp. NPDC048633 TaxID=3157095 RepID=UPI003400C35C
MSSSRATGFPDVVIGTTRRRDELSADLDAVGATAFTGRTSILRRAAALLAEELPTAVDRLVTTGDADAVALTTAVALHTGLPFAVVAGKRPARGDLQRGDRVAVLVPIADEELTTALAEHVRAAGAEPVATLSVLAPDGAFALFPSRSTSENTP